MPWAAVIGDPIEHSLSPVLHRAAWDSLGLDESWQYQRITQTADTVADFLRVLDSQCVGLSVTMPCKQAILPVLDSIEPLAQAVGAVNTVVPAGPVLTGFNTDVEGVTQAVTHAIAPGLPEGTRSSEEFPLRTAVILGAGATASSALAAVKSLGIDQVSVAARRFDGPGSIAMAAHRLGITCDPVSWRAPDAVCRTINNADLVISTLPAYAADDIAALVSPQPRQVLLDVIYQPTTTALVRTFRSAGARIVHGTSMLLYQAVAQVRLMTGQQPDVDVMRSALLQALEERHVS